MFRLSWYQNHDRLDVAVVANRLVAAGMPVWRCHLTAGGIEAGDYLFDGSAALADAIGALGIKVTAAADAGLPPGSEPVRPAGIAVLAGQASAYPYYGYYALALARLGYAFEAVGGGEIAAGGLDPENILVLPGGFSNWTLDRKEGSSGADDAVRAFLSRGGAAVVSCGGAYYLSRGRPGWLGVADARPLNTQEYLRSGVGMVTCRLAPGRHRLGLPPTLEIPYFHGPIWDEIGEGAVPLAHFRDLYEAGRLFIDNPLTEAVFDRDMQGRISALRLSGVRGEAVAFSPHPEMGDLLRKYMALETYIAHYLPIRGELVMRETLDTYRPEESRSFLMILNAIEDLLQKAPAPRPSASPASTTGPSAVPALAALVDAWRVRLAGLRPSAGGIGALELAMATGFEARLHPAAARLRAGLGPLAGSGGDGPRIAASFATLADHAVAAWATPAERRPAERLLELEHALLIVEAWARLAELTLAIGDHV
jgi:hypothetical protein